MPWFRKSSAEGPAPEATPGATETTPPAVERLTEDEVEWVRATIAELAEQGVRLGDIDDLGRHYDELLEGWLRLREADRPEPSGVLDQIGLAFGQHLADHTGLEWCVATDAQGVTIALHRPRTPGRVLLFPVDMVSKRWAAQETRVLPALARATIDAVLQIP
ncbi:MAG TPA: DUF3806 domain-containing protein [Nocardioides sp.]|uniref:DUF3806 domain-containing protein n=1 Tax=Nocardioides sp. TaxID=35761 RepID=UPI002F41D4A7